MRKEKFAKLGPSLPFTLVIRLDVANLRDPSGFPFKCKKQVVLATGQFDSFAEAQEAYESFCEVNGLRYATGETTTFATDDDGVLTKTTKYFRMT